MIKTLSTSAQKVLEQIQKGYTHHKDIAKLLKMKPSDVLRRMNTLKKLGVLSTITTTTIQTRTPNAPIVVVNTPLPKRLKNHFVLVCDGSGSMSSHASGAARLFDAQLDVIKDRKDQDSTVTVYEFDDVVTEKRYNVPVDMVPRFSSSRWPVGGSTALYDAVVTASQRVMADKDPDMSFVVMILTDGQENASRKVSAARLREFITERQATDKWTFVFLVPRGYKQSFVSTSGVHEGNVQEWDQITDREVKEVSKGMVNYMQSRTMGARSSRNWFTTDLSKVSTTDINKLTDITSQTRVWTVDKEEQIQSFVEKHQHFQPGRAFYEVTKKEKQVQDYKKLLIMDRATKRVYADGSVSVRQLLGLPNVGDVALDPGNHGAFRLFAQSTSTNRLLVRGTSLLYW